MSRVVADIFVLIVTVELVLLSIQAEPITATVGYVLAALLFVALLMNVSKNARKS